MSAVEDAPGMLRVRLRDDQHVSGTGHSYPTVLVVAEYAERAAFARSALAVKLRELDVVCAERDLLAAQVDRLAKECRDLARHCEQNDADLDAAIRGDLRRAR